MHCKKSPISKTLHELLLCPLTLGPPALSPSSEGFSGSPSVKLYWFPAAALASQPPSCWPPVHRKTIVKTLSTIGQILLVVLVPVAESQLEPVVDCYVFCLLPVSEQTLCLLLVFLFPYSQARLLSAEVAVLKILSLVLSHLVEPHWTEAASVVELLPSCLSAAVSPAPVDRVRDIYKMR